MNTPDAQPESTQRERVLSAALEVFSREGFEGAAMRDIASIADCNHGMIRYYFKNKDNLWREAVAFLFERMERELDIDETLRKRLANGERDAFEIWLRRYVRYCAEHPDHSRIMVQASIRDDERLTWAVSEFIRRQHADMRHVIRALIARGVLPDHDSVHIGYIIVAACQMLFTLSPEVRRLHAIEIDDGVIDRHADAVVSMILR
jgi:AcrR family transcriptional regulator